MVEKKDLKKIKEYVWEIPLGYRSEMRVPARLYASEKILETLFTDRSLEQLVNTTTLPGVVGYTLAMPDIHEGYGFPIGGVAAINLKEGVISPGGIGYDINCGTRILLSQFTEEELRPYLQDLVKALFKKIPLGVGVGGKIKLSLEDLDEILATGISWAVKKGYGQKEDVQVCEENGSYLQAKAEKVSLRAKQRGLNQLGTLGSGNHFLEVQKVDQIFDEDLAQQWGIFQNQVTFQIHSGSRGLGHQVCSDYVNLFHQKLDQYKIKLPDPELACAPWDSPEGQDYFAAMAAAANFAWANRHLLGHLLREVVEEVLGSKLKKTQLKTLYDVAHNIAKIEEHSLEDQESEVKIKVCVHRKGATRAFPNQPVLIPGSMGTASYILVGTELALKETFGSTCHGAGRIMSRHAAKRQIWGGKLQKSLAQKGIIALSPSLAGLAEEAPLAYKDIEEVIRVVDGAGIAKKVARLVPLGVIKG